MIYNNFGKLSIAILKTCLMGFVLSVLWGWFVVPFGVMALTIPHAVGLAFVVRLFTINFERVEEYKKASMGIKAVIFIDFYLFALAIGWLISLFM